MICVTVMVIQYGIVVSKPTRFSDSSAVACKTTSKCLGARLINSCLKKEEIKKEGKLSHRVLHAKVENHF